MPNQTPEVQVDEYIQNFQEYARSLGAEIPAEENGVFGLETRGVYNQLCYDNGQLKDVNVQPVDYHPLWLVGKVQYFVEFGPVVPPAPEPIDNLGNMAPEAPYILELTNDDHPQPVEVEVEVVVPDAPVTPPADPLEPGAVEPEPNPNPEVVVPVEPIVPITE
jgi:hypothetical protein